jgi:hypothetical protein
MCEFRFFKQYVFLSCLQNTNDSAMLWDIKDILFGGMTVKSPYASLQVAKLANR